MMLFFCLPQLLERRRGGHAWKVEPPSRAELPVGGDQPGDGLSQKELQNSFLGSAVLSAVLDSFLWVLGC